MKTAPDLRDIVVFGSTFGVRRDPGKKSLAPQSEEGQIIGRNDETKGYRVYLPKSNIVITTQHVRDIAKLSAEQNERLLRGISDPVVRRDAVSATNPGPSPELAQEATEATQSRAESSSGTAQQR